MGGAPVRRSQAVAWLTAVPLAGPGERQYGGTTGRGGTEPQPVVGRDRVGAAPRAAGEPGGPTGSDARAARRAPLIRSVPSARDGSIPRLLPEFLGDLRSAPFSTGCL